MKTLVTGGTGFLGMEVVRELVGREGPAAVRCLVRRETRGLERLGVEQVLGDVENRESLARALDGVAIVQHLAGLVSRDVKDAGKMMRVHVDGTRHLLEEAARLGVKRMVVASSSGTIAVSKNETFIATEDAPYAEEVVAGWPYYMSKIFQEKLAFTLGAKLGLEIVVLNPSLLLGPGDARGSSTEDVLRFLQKKIPVVPPGGVNFVDVRDAAAAFVEAASKGRAGERYLLGGPNWTMETFFGRLERMSKVAGPRLKIGTKLARGAASVMQAWADFRGRAPSVDPISVEMSEHFWYVDSSKAQRELAFQSRDPQETLADTIRYLRHHFLAQDSQILTP